MITISFHKWLSSEEWSRIKKIVTSYIVTKCENRLFVPSLNWQALLEAQGCFWEQRLSAYISRGVCHFLPVLHITDSTWLGSRLGGVCKICGGQVLIIVLKVMQSNTEASLLYSWVSLLLLCIKGYHFFSWRKALTAGSDFDFLYMIGEFQVSDEFYTKQTYIFVRHNRLTQYSGSIWWYRLLMDISKEYSSV